MKRKILLGAVVLFLVGTMIFTVWSRKEKTVQATVSQLVSVDVVKPSRVTMKRVVEVFGALSPKTATELKNEVPGSILNMRVKEWDDVDPGDILCELDPTDFRLALVKAEAGLNMAKAKFLQAKVDLNRAKRERDRAQKLKDGGLVTGQELDERITVMESAQAGLAIAQAQVGQAESLVAETRRILDKAVVKSPIKGTVYQRKVDVGEWVDKGVLLFSIVDNRILDFTASVPATELSLVSEGRLLSFTVDGLPDRVFQGRVKRVNPMVNSADRSGRVQAEVVNSDGSLRGGVFARGSIVVEERPDVLSVPKATLMGWDILKCKAKLFLVDKDGVARIRDVDTGLVDDDSVEIRSGLQGTETVVLRGGFNLREGERVRIADPAPRKAGN